MFIIVACLFFAKIIWDIAFGKDDARGNSALPMGNGMMHIITSLPRSARKAKGFWRVRRQMRTCCGFAVGTERKPDPCEPGGSGRLPKPPFQPLACALSSWALLMWAVALPSPPAAQGQPWLLPLCVQSLVRGVRGK